MGRMENSMSHCKEVSCVVKQRLIRCRKCRKEYTSLFEKEVTALGDLDQRNNGSIMNRGNGSIRQLGSKMNEFLPSLSSVLPRPSMGDDMCFTVGADMY